MNLKQLTPTGPSTFIATIVLVLMSCTQLYSATSTFKEDVIGTSTNRDNSHLSSIILDEIEFKKARVQDAVRVISELTDVNIVATEEAGNAIVSLFVKRLSVEDIIDSICRIAGLWYRYNPKSGIYIVMTTTEYQRDIVVFKNEPTKMFKLKYLNVGIAARTIADLFGDRVELLGKANRHLGDDYKLTSLNTNFAEDYDDGEMDTDDSDTDENDDNDNGSNRSRISSNSRQEYSKSELSTGQIDLLEDLTKKQLQAVTEGLVSQVVQRADTPIYVTVNRLHNMLFVRTSDNKAMEQIAQIIEDSDLQVPEVLLEMKVLEVQLTDQFQSAFDISNLSGTTETGSSDGHSINPLNTSASSVTSSLTSAGNFGIMEGSTLVFQALSDNIRVRLQLLEQNNNITALATPMLLAANNHAARLFIGEETVITTGFEAQDVEVTSGDDITITSYPVPVTEVQSIGNTLTILPSINADGTVVMRLLHENSTVEKEGGTIPLLVGSNVEQVAIDTINTSTLEATVLAHDGMTVAVGGMMRTSTIKSESKVPVLGDIPLLGFFFKEINDLDIKTELVLLITPHILRKPSDGEAVTQHRMSDLLDHPNRLDAYLDSMPEQRAAIQQQRLSATIIGEDVVQKKLQLDPVVQEETTTLSGQEKAFIDLIRVAAQQRHTPFLLRRPKGRITPVTLLSLGQSQIFQDPSIITKADASWSNGLHYVTAIKVINRSSSSKTLDVGSMIQSWHAATLEQQALAPMGEEGDSTYLYLISDQKFEKAVRGEGQ